MRIFSLIKVNFIALVLLFLCSSIFATSGRPVSSKNGMVVSACAYASEVGIEILKSGGNAVDGDLPNRGFDGGEPLRVRFCCRRRGAESQGAGP